MKKAVAEILDRDLKKLDEEISSYDHDSDLWNVDGAILNSAGNLCLHICGNLQHFIGAVLGSSGYRRNREYEFSAKGLSRVALRKEIETTQKAVSRTFASMKDEILKEDFPEKLLDKTLTTEFLLIHLCAHLNYHLGQINYHRRLTA